MHYDKYPWNLDKIFPFVLYLIPGTSYEISIIYYICVYINNLVIEYLLCISLFWYLKD